MSDHTQPAPEPADIQPTPESVEAARGLVYKVLDDLECLMGRRLVRVIAEYLTRNDRELTRWVNQEIREKTECLQQSFVVEAERRMRAQPEVDELKQEVGRLKGLIERDRTGLAAGLAQVRQIAKSWSWLGDNEDWGCYSWPERTVEALRSEMERCLDAVEKAALGALQRSGANVTEAFHGTTWTHDLPKDPAGLEQCIERLRRTDGTHADAAVIVWEQCQMLVMEIDRLRSVIARHDLCHNLHGQVDARAFADGCTDEQRKLFGCAPDADAVARLRAALERIACRDQGEVGPHMEEPRSAAIAREVLG